MTEKRRGRPRLNKPPRVGRWEPQTWKPEYAEMVVYSATGVSNTTLAERFSCTPQHVSNVLNTTKAKELLAQLSDATMASALAKIPAKLERIATKTVEHWANLVEDEELFKKAPIQFIDRGIRVLEHLGHIKTKVAVNVDNKTQNNIVLPPGAAADIVAALAKAEEVRLLHGGV